MSDISGSIVISSFTINEEQTKWGEGNVDFAITLIDDYRTEGPEYFVIKVYSDDAFNNEVASSNVITINDTSLELVTSYSIITLSLIHI